jgi:hypothetical protein
MIHCQTALGMTQAEMGAMLGKDRRTIQRWQDRGCSLLPGDAATLASALRPGHPDLADKVLALGRETADQLGMPPATTPEMIAAIVQAAAAAGGTTPDAIRPAVAAAFAKAAAMGADARAVAAALGSNAQP